MILTHYTFESWNQFYLVKFQSRNIFCLKTDYEQLEVIVPSLFLQKLNLFFFIFYFKHCPVLETCKFGRGFISRKWVFIIPYQLFLQSIFHHSTLLPNTWIYAPGRLSNSLLYNVTTDIALVSVNYTIKNKSICLWELPTSLWMVKWAWVLAFGDKRGVWRGFRKLAADMSPSSSLLLFLTRIWPGHTITVQLRLEFAANQDGSLSQLAKWVCMEPVYSVPGSSSQCCNEASALISAKFMFAFILSTVLCIWV